MSQRKNGYVLGTMDAELTLTLWYNDGAAKNVYDAIDEAMSSVAWNLDLGIVCKAAAEAAKKALEASKAKGPVVIEAKAASERGTSGEWLKSSESFAKTTLLACMPEHGFLSAPGEDIPLPSTD